MLRVLAVAVPIAVAALFSLVASRLVPAPSGLVPHVVWLLAILACSTMVLLLTDRLARQVLPLAALLKLSLVFPDHVPSRFSVALRTGTTRQLQRRLQLANENAATTAGATELLALVAALNHHDPLTRGHAERVRALADLLGEQLQLDDDDRDKLRWAALLHDIGKLKVPAEILRKSGAPTADEWKLLKTHPAEGMELVRGPIADWLGEWTRAIGEHHEWFDGSGYPLGLSGHDIAYGGRLVAVVDVFDVITAARSYKSPMTIYEAQRELTRCAGTQFDPEMVRAFLQISIGDLRRAMGPLSWIAQLAILGRLAAAPAASSLAGGVIAATSLGLGPVGNALSEPPTRTPVVQQQDLVPPAPAPELDAMATTSIAIGSTAAPGASTPSPSPGHAPGSAPVDAVENVPGAVPGTSIPALPPTSIPVVNVPPTTVPTVTLPTVTLPTATTPTVTLPTVSLPGVTLPSITLPTVTLPHRP